MSRGKICGISEIEHALAAAQAGADFLGLVLAESRRQVTPQKAREIAAAVRALKAPPKLAGVFVNAPAAEVNRIAKYLALDYVQLSGDEGWDYCKEIKYPVIKVIHVSDDTKSEEIISQLTMGRLTGNDFIPLLDTRAGEHYGGSGVRFDWQIAKAVAAECDIIVAGGLNPQNVGELVRQVKPWGVDVSSGVETNGRKDSEKIRAFIKAARGQDVT